MGTLISRLAGTPCPLIFGALQEHTFGVSWGRFLGRVLSTCVGPVWNHFLSQLASQRICNGMAGDQDPKHRVGNQIVPQVVGNLRTTRQPVVNHLRFCVYRWPRTFVPHATKSPDTGTCRTASRTMRTAVHCRPRACKTWTCTISNTMVIKELISFSLYFFNLYCIAYCTPPRFTGPGAKPGMRGWTVGRAPERPQAPTGRQTKLNMSMNGIT